MSCRRPEGPLRVHHPAATLRPRLQLLLPTAIALAAALAYLPALDNDFVDWDDHLWITDNPRIADANGLLKAWTTPGSAYYYPCPLTFTSFWLEYRLWGLDPHGYHATNVALHAVNTLLVWHLLRALGLSTWLASWSAALFALHPMQVQSVAWITERKNLLSGFFFLTSLLLYLRHRRSSARFSYALSLIAFACAVLSKAAAVVLPLVILWTEWLIQIPAAQASRRSRPGPWLRSAPFFAIAAAVALLSMVMETPSAGEARPVLQRILTAAAIPWFYLYKLILPLHLRPLYPQWNIQPDALACWLPLAALALAAGLFLRYRARLNPHLLWGLGFAVITLLPMMGLVQYSFFRFSFVADHYVYLCCLGLFLPLGIVLRKACHRLWSERRAWTAATLTAVVCLAFLATRTWSRCFLWRDSKTILTETLRYYPDFWMAWSNLGNVYARQGDHDRAVNHYRRALAINPHHTETHFNLAKALAAGGDLHSAAQHYRQALRLRPDFLKPRLGLANCLLAQDKFDTAIDQYRFAAEIAPQDPLVLCNLGHALTRAGRADQASQVLHQAVNLAPDLPQAHYNYAIALTGENRHHQALTQYQQCLKLQPHHARAENNLGTLLAQLGRHDDAAAHFRRALQLDPQDLQTCANLGMTLMLQGQFQEARDLLQKAHARSKTDLQIALTLAWLLATCPDDKVRNGHQALTVGRCACQTTDFNNPRALDVLACAYAELGQFPQAQQCARQALQLAQQQGHHPWTRRFQEHLQAFNAHRPHREPARRAPAP